jgi:hypothetical protein
MIVKSIKDNQEFRIRKKLNNISIPNLGAVDASLNIKKKENEQLYDQNKTYGVDGVLEVLSCNSLLVLN